MNVTYDWTPPPGWIVSARGDDDDWDDEDDEEDEDYGAGSIVLPQAAGSMTFIAKCAHTVFGGTVHLPGSRPAPELGKTDHGDERHTIEITSLEMLCALSAQTDNDIIIGWDKDDPPGMPYVMLYDGSLE